MGELKDSQKIFLIFTKLIVYSTSGIFMYKFYSQIGIPKMKQIISEYYNITIPTF